MSDFKEQFNHIFEEAPSFSEQARQQVKHQLHSKKKRQWMPSTVVAVIAVALVSIVMWNTDWFGMGGQEQANLAAPEHVDQFEIFTEVTPDNVTQFVISNKVNSMNRNNEEYKGYIAIETDYDGLEYGQVALLQDEMVDGAFRYSIGRIIGKPGDKVAINEGQLYLNDLPVQTFYGKAQVMGTTDVEEAFERLKKANATEFRESIEEALHTSMEPIVLQPNELFIVSDNWARNGVRKTYQMDKVEGVVLGYSALSSTHNGWRALNEDELAITKDLSVKFFDGLRNQDRQAIESISTELFFMEDKYFEYMLERGDHILQIDGSNLSDAIVNHYVSYYEYAYLGNPYIGLKKSIYVLFEVGNETLVLNFEVENDEWKLNSSFFE